MKNPYILCAAIHFEDDLFHDHQPKNILTGFVVCGRRHNNVYNTLKVLEIDRHEYLTLESTQGFITSDDRFVDRKEAVEIALAAGQISEPKKQLYSEDLY